MNFENFINGKFVPSAGRSASRSTNPSTGQTICTVPDSTAADVDAALDAAAAAQAAWAKRPAIERAKALRPSPPKIRDTCGTARAHHHRRARQDPRLARVEVAFTADYFDYMAEWARRIEGEIIESDRPGETIFLFRQPIGVIGGILPWNFPFFLIARKAAPALVTGNTIVIKPSEETPHNAVKFCELLAETRSAARRHQRGPRPRRDGGQGARVIAAHRHDQLHRQRGDRLGHHGVGGAEHHQSQSRTRRQSSGHRHGRRRYRSRGQRDQGIARHQQRPGLQLRRARLRAAQRRRPVRRQTHARPCKATRFGDPLADADRGIRSAHQRSRLPQSRSLVRRRGSGRRDDRRPAASAPTGEGGYYYEPTVITGCTQEMDIIRREVFGPVVPVVTFDDLDEAIAFANDSDYGLTSSIYTRDLNVALRACQEIRFGETYINRENFEAMQGFHAGWRKSGIGGADGKHGLYEFTQTHVVYMQRQ